MGSRLRWVGLAALLLLTTTLAGCIGQDTAGPDEPVDPASTPGTAGPEALWDHPQTAPHPAYDYPTYTDLPTDAPDWWTPIDPAEVPDEIAGVTHEGQATKGPASGNGIAIFGSLALVSGDPTTIVDISDPQNPVTLSEIDVSTRDADTIAYPDGRLVAIFATGSGVLPFYDLTDPANPVELGGLEPSVATHNIAVVPGTPIVYNANSAGGGARTPDAGTGVTEIYDLSDPEDPVHVQDWGNGFGCHDITFYSDEDAGKHRAYCAGIEFTQIWDIEDPTEPTVVSNVPVHHGNPDLPSGVASIVFFSHLAMVNDDASVLIVGDETGGGLAPACDAYADGQAATVSGPLGNLYFYDITDEENPQLLSWLSPSHHYPTNPPANAEGELNPAGCTAHFGKIVPDAEQDLLAIAFYGAGVELVDFTDPSHPIIAEQWNEGTNTWDVWYYQGYLFTGDMSRGMDVFTLR